MIALCIIVILLLLLLILPVGVDAAYLDGVFSLKLKLGPVRKTLLPKKQKEDAPEEPKKKKKKKKKKKDGDAEKPKKKLGLGDVLELAKIALKALGRFRRSLSIDVFMLHVVLAAADPFDAVTQSGYLNAGLGALSPLFHKALKVRSEDVQTGLDVLPGSIAFEGRIVATLQIWEILHIANCAGAAFLRWYLRRRRAARAEEKCLKQKG